MKINKFIIAAFAISGALLPLSCESTKELEERLDNMELNTIAPISRQVTSISKSIEELTEARRGIDNSIKLLEIKQAGLDSLWAMDNVLGQRINELKTYVDVSLPGFAETEWVKATFATLEQYEATCKTIAAVEQTVSGAGKMVDSKLTAAIEASKESIKNWINPKFSDYYTVAQTDAKLADFSSRLEELEAVQESQNADIAQMKADLNKDREDLRQAEADITEGYRNAIKAAIDSCDGRLDNLEEYIAGAKSDIDGIISRLSELKTAINDMEADVAALEARLQSVNFVPEYQKAIAIFETYIGSYTDQELTFSITPTASASSVASLFTADSTTVTAEWECPSAGSAADRTLKISDLTVKDAAAGTISVTIDSESLNASPAFEALTSGSGSFSLCLHIVTGATDIRSEYIGIISDELIVDIPDSTFKAYCLARFDYDGDGEISFEEAATADSINVSNAEIKSLEGIGAFVSLKRLNCSRNPLNVLDISRNTALTYLNCSNTNLNALDVSRNAAMDSLICNVNELRELNVTGNRALKLLNCRNNLLTGLNLNENTALRYLDCGGNRLTGDLDLRSNTALTYFSCMGNPNPINVLMKQLHEFIEKYCDSLVTIYYE